MSTVIGFIALLLGAIGCNHKLEMQEGAPFEVSNMPYHNNATLRQPTEIRLNLNSEDSFEGTKYTVRYFPYQGKGYLRIGGAGKPLTPNDKFSVKRGDFRMYYTPLTTGAHQLELVFENNHGQSYTITLSFSVPNQGGSNGGNNDNGNDDPTNGLSNDLATAEASVVKVGEAYLGTDGFWYINGENTGVKASADPNLFAPTLESKDGYWYINDAKSVLSANENEQGDLSIGDNGNWYINGEDSWVKAPELEKPSVTVNSNKNYAVNGQDTSIPAPNLDPLISDDDYIIRNTVNMAKENVPQGQVSVLLVSKQGETEVNGEMVDYTGLVLEDGNAIYRVYDVNKNPAPNAIVRNMPELNSKTYQADKAGYFIVPNKDLPTKGDMMPASVSVSIGGKHYQSGVSTVVPNQIKVGIELAFNRKNTYHFQFVEVQGDNESGKISLPIAVPVEKFLYRGNFFSYLLTCHIKGAKLDLNRHYLNYNKFGLDGGHFGIGFPLPFSEFPKVNQEIPAYIIFVVPKGPFGAEIRSVIFLGFGDKEPLNVVKGGGKFLPF